MIGNEVFVESKLIMNLVSGDTKQKKGGTQKFLTVEVRSAVRNWVIRS